MFEEYFFDDEIGFVPSRCNECGKYDVSLNKDLDLWLCEICLFWLDDEDNPRLRD